MRAYKYNLYFVTSQRKEIILSLSQDSQYAAKEFVDHRYNYTLAVCSTRSLCCLCGVFTSCNSHGHRVFNSWNALPECASLLDGLGLHGDAAVGNLQVLQCVARYLLPRYITR